MADQVTTSLEQAKILVMQGLAGKAPRVNATNNHWEVYDNDSQSWVGTGVDAVGEDGFSPTVSVAAITGGHRVTITDEDGAHTFDVMDGGLPELTSADNGKVLMADEGEWVKAFLTVDHPVKAATYGTTTAAEIIGWVQDGETVFMWYDNRMYYYVFHQMGSAYFLSEYGNKFYYAYVTVDTWNTGVVEIAPKNSPTFTGEPKAPTPSAGDNSTKIATTEFVQTALASIGTVFTLKGGVATVNDLPQTGNGIGDVYYVESVSAGFIWITSTEYPNGYWEELGETIDMSAYQTKAISDTGGYFSTDTVEGALQEIGAELSGVNTLIGSGVIT